MTQDKPSRAEAQKTHAEYWSDFAAASNQGHPPMTEPTSQAAKQRACDLANAAGRSECFYVPSDCEPGNRASMQALAQLCQVVSDAVEAIPHGGNINQFILPKPAPDVLAEALRDIHHLTLARSLDANALRAALAQRGHEVAPIKPTTA